MKKRHYSNLKNILLFVMALFVLFFISSCSGQKNSTPMSDYKTGTQGLELSFLRNSPPSVVFAEDGRFPVSVEIRNKGIYPGEGDGSLVAYLFYTGFDPYIVSNLYPETVTFDEEEAKTRYNPEGGINTVNSEAYIDSNYFKTSKIDSYPITLKAVICYPYKTFGTADVCIDPNPNKDSSSDTCTPGVTSTGSQGAPVAITSVESIAQKGKGRFIINIANVGGGEVLRESAIGSCMDVNIDRSDLDKVTILNAQLSNGIPLDCTPNDEVNLINGRATIVCKAEGIDENMPAIKSLLNIELAYGYKKSISTNVRIIGDS